jgi:release factor glutamine methyltransferase
MDDLVRRLRAAGCVFAEDEAALLVAEFPTAQHLERAVVRREAGEPLEHILGWVEFAGVRVPVAPSVFVPRRRTELVARLAVAHLPQSGTVVDLCCGAGAIALAIATARPDAVVWAADIDPVAVALAENSLAPLGGKAVIGDMDAGLPTSLARTCDVVAACPPYVPSAQITLMPREARDYEPRRALDGGPDGTDLQARVFEAASRLLKPGGVVIVETSDSQSERTSERAIQAGLSPSVVHDDELGAAVVVAMNTLAHAR